MKHYIYDGEIIKESRQDIFLIICAVCFVIVFALFVIMVVLSIRKKMKDRNAKIFWNISASVVLFIVSVGILGFSFIVTFGDEIVYEPEYYEFSDGNHTIVICERSFLLGGYADIYQVNDDSSAYLIEKFTTDDGYRNRGNYDFEWSDDYVKIYYEDGNSLTDACTTVYFVD